MDEELAAHIAGLARRAEQYEPKPWPRLTDGERDDVHWLLDKFSDERATRAAAHCQRLVSRARHLGREVRAHRVTVDDAERRLDVLAGTTEDESGTPIAVVLYGEAIAIARHAFAEGFGEQSCPI